MSIIERFNTFLENIRLTNLQIEDARAKYGGVCKKLHDHFYIEAYDGSTKLLVGSYGKGTNIRPARDIDIYFKLPWSEFTESSSTYNVQSTLLQRIRNILLSKYSDTNIRGDNQVVVVNFSNGHFVEVAPCFESTMDATSGKFYIPNTGNGGSWQLADPRSEMKNISDSDSKSNYNTKNLIKMLKKWQENCQVPIKSIVIELRAVNFLNSYIYADKSVLYYDLMIRDYFAKLLEYVNGSCKMPGLEEKIQYGDAWESKAQSAYARAKKACEYEAKGDDYNATLEWKKIFGDDYYF